MHSVPHCCPLVFHRPCFNEETDLLTISRKGPSRTSMGSPWKPLLLLSVISGLAGMRAAVRLYQDKRLPFLKTATACLYLPLSLFLWATLTKGCRETLPNIFVIQGLLVLHCPRIHIICSFHNAVEVLSWTVSMVMAWLSKHQIA